MRVKYAQFEKARQRRMAAFSDVAKENERGRMKDENSSGCLFAY